MSPEDVQSAMEVVKIVGGAFAGIIGTIGAQKYQQKHRVAPPSIPTDVENDMFSAMENLGDRLSDKIDRVARIQLGTKLQVEGIHEEVQRNTHDIAKINRSLTAVTGRVEGLEARADTPT